MNVFDTLRDMKFVPCKADPDLWMRDAGHCYEYICVYVDDIMAMMALQWCITLGRFDIVVGVMTMSRFRAAPREGHMKRLQYIWVI